MPARSVARAARSNTSRLANPYTPVQNVDEMRFFSANARTRGPPSSSSRNEYALVPVESSSHPIHAAQPSAGTSNADGAYSLSLSSSTSGSSRFTASPRTCRPASAVSAAPRVANSTHAKWHRTRLNRFTTICSKLYGRRCAP